MSDNKRPASEDAAAADAKRTCPDAPAPAEMSWDEMVEKMRPFAVARDEKTTEIKEACEKIERIERSAREETQMLRAMIAVAEAESVLIDRREIAAGAGFKVWRIFSSVGHSVFFKSEADARAAWEAMVVATGGDHAFLKMKFREPELVPLPANFTSTAEAVDNADKRLGEVMKQCRPTVFVRVHLKGSTWVAAFHTREAAEAAEALAREVAPNITRVEITTKFYGDIGGQLQGWFDAGDAAAQEGLLSYVRKNK